jgi:hypothetical protein
VDIALPVQPGDNFVLLVVRRVCEGVDVRGKAGRRGSVYAGYVVVDANLITGQSGSADLCTAEGITDLFCRIFDGLLYEVD